MKVEISQNRYMRGDQPISNFIIKKLHFKGSFGEKELLIITLVNQYGNKISTVFNKKITLYSFNIHVLCMGNYVFGGTKKELTSIIDELKSKCSNTIYQ